MKHYEEIANRVFERRDAYVARQKKRRQTAIRVTSVVSSFVLVALLGVGIWQSGWLTPEAPMVEEPHATGTTAPVSTTAPTTEKLDGTGGDEEECTVHSARYHRIPSNFRAYDMEVYLETKKEQDGETINIVDFIEFFDISRETFIEAMKWDAVNLDEKIDDDEGDRYCPYTYNQYLDAIYGDDEELKAWVFAPEINWPKAETWSLIGEEGLCPEEWPPEGYGFGETRPSESEEDSGIDETQPSEIAE